MQTSHLAFRDGELAARLPGSVSLPLALLFALGAIVVLVLLVRRALQHRAWADEAREVMTQAKERALRPGVHVLAGRVHTADRQPAIRVRIRETGSQWQNKHGDHQHRWTEVHREVDVRPFDLVTESGAVRVEPDASVKLVDELVTVRRITVDEREREASLDAGEHVFVSGLVRRLRGEGAYRGGGGGWVMRAAPGATLVCSTASLCEPHERWARFYRGAALVCALPALAITAFLTLSYFPLAFGGVVVEGRVVGREHRVVRDRRTRHYWEVTAHATLPDGRPVVLEDDLRAEAWAQIQEGDVLPFVVLPAHPELHQVGRRPGLAAWAVGVAFALAVVPGMGFVVAWRRRRAWWEQDSVVTYAHGRLEDSF